MSYKIEVVPYDPQWSDLFDQEAKLLHSVLGDNCLAIHHIGSTAVPGLSAKPIIDMIPVVKDILRVDTITSNLQFLGYEAMGELGMPFRRYFRKGNPIRTHHIHIFEERNGEIERHLTFRDYLRSTPSAVEAYASLKRKLALEHPKNMLAYCLGKNDLIQQIDQSAGFSGTRMVQTLTQNEWEAYERIRTSEIFRGKPDPYTWTFHKEEHLHLVFWKGATIIGCAHIQLWPEKRAALRIIAIEAPFQKKGFGLQFLKLIERWLKHKGIHSLHIQASPKAYGFYKALKYIEMPFDDPENHGSDAKDIDVGKVL
jgi:GrpB-like predicted nucleotidyltransferase (UPF0157 family)